MITVRTTEGRDLEVLVEGPDDGDVLVFHHGTPGSALCTPGLVEAAAARGLRTVVASRPGYGESSPQPGRRVADAASDTAVLLDSLGVDRFLTLGWSGGGPHALACAALLPERCEVAGAVAGVAPYDLFGDGWTDGMGEDNVIEFSAAAAGRTALEEHLGDVDRGEATLDDVRADFATLMSPVDVAAFDAGMGAYHLAGSAHGVRHGTGGWLDDDLAFTAPWGFELGSIVVPLVLWHGRQDKMVPFTHAQWLAERLPGVRAHLIDDQGHMSLMTTPDTLVDELLRARLA